MNVGFFSVALKPKWIGGLLLALAAAAVFAALGQWQLERAFIAQPAPSPSFSSGETAVPRQIDSLLAPGDQLLASAADQLAFANLKLDTQKIDIVANRVQLAGDHSETGFWLIGQTTAQNGAALTVALGWSPSLEKAESARNFMIQMADMAGGYLPVEGRLEPSEEPKSADPNKPYLYESLSIAQLINAHGASEATKTYDAFFVVSRGLPTGGLERIAIGKTRDAGQLNLLNAFYAAEWALFAGFAFFMWWRMVRDEVIRLRAEALGAER